MSIVVGNDAEHKLLALLRIALNCSAEAANDKQIFSLSAEDWRNILDLAAAHTVTGLIYAAVKKLPSDLCPPDNISLKLMMEAERIERYSRKVESFTEKLVSELKGASLAPVFMKGHEVAKYYPEPYLRVCGDIDVYFQPSEFQMAVSFFKEKGYAPQRRPDRSFFSNSGPGIDIHPYYFDLHVRLEKLPPVPSTEAVLLMLSSHILKHAMGPGVGLRQICDMVVCLKAFTGNSAESNCTYDSVQLEEYFQAAHVATWNKVLLAFISRYFGLDTAMFSGSVNAGQPLPKKIRKLLSSFERIVFSGGNFGFYNISRKKTATSKFSGKRKIDTFYRFLRNTPFSLRCSPREFFSYTFSLLKGNLD